jgi:predicted secreted protein
VVAVAMQAQQAIKFEKRPQSCNVPDADRQGKWKQKPKYVEGLIVESLGNRA